MINIVVLDGKTTNPGDLSWEPLSALGSLTVHDETPQELVISRSINADAIILNRVVMNREIMLKLPCLKFLGTLATGYNTIDTAAARELGITVCNVPIYCVEAVAQHVFSLLLSLCGNVHRFSAKVSEGFWHEAEAMNFSQYPIFELHGKTLGILGYGNIGKHVASIGLALGMKVAVYSRTKKELPHGCFSVSLEDLFRESNVISIHCPLTKETKGLVGNALLSLMKPTAFLINTSRGAILNEQSVADALNTGKIAGAGLDVLTKEPPDCENPLLTAKNCLITPHIAWATKDARERLIATVSENLRKFQNGTPQNEVSNS